MTRWHHGHSIGVGLLIGFLLSRNLLWAVSAAFVAGLLWGRLWAAVTRIVSHLTHRSAVTVLPPRRPW